MSTLGTLFKYEAFNMKYQRGKGIFDSKATSVMVVEEQRQTKPLELLLREQNGPGGTEGRGLVRLSCCLSLLKIHFLLFLSFISLVSQFAIGDDDIAVKLLS